MTRLRLLQKSARHSTTLPPHRSRAIRIVPSCCSRSSATRTRASDKAWGGIPERGMGTTRRVQCAASIEGEWAGAAAP